MLDAILTSLVTALTHASTLAVAALIAKSFFDRALSRDLERFKGVLTKDLETHKSTLADQSAQFKHQLEASDFAHRKALVLLVEKQAEVIASAYAKMSQAKRDLEIMVSTWNPAQVDENKLKQDKARLSWSALQNYIQDHEVYFTVETSKKLAALVDIVAATYFEHHVGTSGPGSGRGSDSAQKARFDQWVSARQRMETEFPRAMEAVADDFRRLLAVVPASAVADPLTNSG